MSDCGVFVHASLEVGIALSRRAVTALTWLALTASASCAPAIRPTAPPAPASPDRLPPPAVSTAPVGAGIARDTTRVAARPNTVVPDSVDAALRQAIERVSALFDVPDSVVRGRAASAVVDVDSTSNVGGPTWDIDVDSYVTQEKVAHYVKLFLGTARARFVERLQRGKTYEAMIREKFRAAGIPEDMYYLGLVESGYDPHAYSRAAAVGMWQFMSSTARSVGLRVDWWVDERRDPVRATDAAARFIRDLRAQFGSLYLAAAAYNGGPGRVSRGLKKFDDALLDVSGEDCFFALAEQDYLRAETKNYVPQLIAAALIGKSPARFGIVLDSLPRFSSDSVLVPPLTPLSAVAKALGIPVRDLQMLNGQILRGVTPPSGQVTLRVPVGKAVGFDARLAALDPVEREPFTKVVTRKNESIAGLAQRYDLQPRQLQWYNRKIAVRRGKLSPGQTLLIPTADVVRGAFDIPDPSIERYGSSAGGARSGRTTHLVRKGESLGSIARRYHTSVGTLVSLNRLKRQVIYPGQAIIVSRGVASRSRSNGVARKKSTGKEPTASSAAKAKTSNKARRSSTRKRASPSKRSTVGQKKATVSNRPATADKKKATDSKK